MNYNSCEEYRQCTIKLLKKSFIITSGIRNPLCRQRLRELLILRDSTTNYFERLTGMILKVAVLEQIEKKKDDRISICRESLLYLDSVELPIAYCICDISKSTLKDYEFEQIKNGNVPLGKVLGIDENSRLTKGNIFIDGVYDSNLIDKLKTREDKCFIKDYDLFFNDKVICNIKEIVNVESFSRLLEVAT